MIFFLFVEPSIYLYSQWIFLESVESFLQFFYKCDMFLIFTITFSLRIYKKNTNKIFIFSIHVTDIIFAMHLSTTFIPIIIIMHIYNWYHSIQHAFFCISNIDYNVHGTFPLLYWLPLLIPLVPLSDPLSLTLNPPSCDRTRPPRSQVACKLTSPFSTLFPTHPLQIPRTQITQRLTKMTLRRIRRLLSGTRKITIHTRKHERQCIIYCT